jgi:hypothetical protein
MLRWGKSSWFMRRGRWWKACRGGSDVVFYSGRLEEIGGIEIRRIGVQEK